jgi:hypothetical protein
VAGVDLGHESVALTGEPVDGPLGIADEVDEPRRVTATYLTALGGGVGGGQQQACAQAHGRHAETPGGRPRGAHRPLLGRVQISLSDDVLG